MKNSTIDPSKFAEMLCTRLCHDIIGPVGAVSNGAEFLREEMPHLNSQAMDLIEKSSQEAVARVQFYRQAYGTGPKASAASLTETKNIVKNFFTGSKIELVWEDKFTDMSAIDINYAQKKLLMNLLIIAAGALIRGGKVIFSIEPAKFEIRAEGQTVKLDAEMESCLKKAAGAEVTDPKLVQAIYTRALADETGAKIGLEKTDAYLLLTVTL